jgi:polyphosphate kinase
LRRDAAHERTSGARRGDDGRTAEERLALVEQAVLELLHAQSRCAEECLAAAAHAGARIARWQDLSPDEREAMRRRFEDEMIPGVSPLTLTLSPGHPVPHLPHLGLLLAVVFRRDSDDRPHIGELELPLDLPRLLPLPGRNTTVIAIEELLRANIDLLYPGAQIDGAHLFRVTRRGDLVLNEDDAAENLLEAVADATERRPYNAAVRVEVERNTPAVVRDLVLESLRRDAATRDGGEVVDHVQVIDGLLDLRCLARLALPATANPEYPALNARAPIAGDASLFAAIRAQDLLVHHPFESFRDTVVRFIEDASMDPHVSCIQMTLYRLGDPSPVVAALLRAAQSGKRVEVLVELQARFDEVQNVAWARALERAGGRVIYGVAGLKTHVKAARVVRRESDGDVTYVHVGTGNYNPRSGEQYTDLSLFSSRADLVSDVTALFASLLSSVRAPQPLSHGALVAPEQLLGGIIARIDREAGIARAGRTARITIKVNGLADNEVVRALYRAAESGVEIALIVRGICTMRTVTPGGGARVRIISVVGRWLEHSRIYRFHNDGAGEYFIGSADLRPRNLRRRVEMLVPIHAAAHRAMLDAVLELYLTGGGAWDLDDDGTYHQRADDAPGAQERLAAGPLID